MLFLPKKKNQTTIFYGIIHEINEKYFLKSVGVHSQKISRFKIKKQGINPIIISRPGSWIEMEEGQEGNKQFFWATATNQIGAALFMVIRHLLCGG